MFVENGPTLNINGSNGSDSHNSTRQARRVVADAEERVGNHFQPVE